MGKKYIIELESGTHIFILGPEGIVHIGEPDVVYNTVDGMQIGDAVINAKPYTEPDLEQVRKEAYEAGAKSSAVVIADDKAHEAYKFGYENGLNDAWDAARKIVDLWRDIPNDELMKIFDVRGNWGESVLSLIMRCLPPSEAIEKIRQYEQEKEMDGLRQNIQTIVDQCGYTLEEIAEVLKEMRDDGNRIQETMSDDY